MVDIKSEIISSLKTVIKDLASQGLAWEASDLVLQTPKDENHGDYASNIALAIFSSSKFKIQSSKFRSPLEFAQHISQTLNSQLSTLSFLDKVEAVKPGFINFWISKEYLVSQLSKKYEPKPQDPNKKVIVEYSSPNIAKPFTVGHLRSTIIGDAIANLLQANGWTVFRDNHLGDWGTQFGKQIYAIKTWGNEEKIEKSENPVKELVALYVKFHEEAEENPELEEEGRRWFKKLEEGDQEARRLWKKCVDWSLIEFKNIYKVLGVQFTENDGLGYGESFFEDKIKDVIQELEDKKLLTSSDGAKLVFFDKNFSAGPNEVKYPPLMIVKKDGASLYSTRDLATDKFRLKKYGNDTVIINEVGIEQSLYFRQLYELEAMLGWVDYDGQRIHVRHGHYRFKDEKMSTRKGNVIWLEDVLSEAKIRSLKIMDDAKKHKTLSALTEANIGFAVGIGAIKWNDLKRTSHLDIVFDWDEILNMEGNSGPYVQYSYVRTQSVLEKVGEFSQKDLKTPKQIEPAELSLLRALNRFPEVVEEAGKNYAPNLLCNYLFDLSQKFNLFYQKHKILESEQKDFRLALTQAVGQVIKTGLNLLGIQSPEKM